MASSQETPVLEIENLNISFFTRHGEIPAVMDFSCRVMPGDAMGLVGESGCGKSTVALGVMRYLGKNGRITSGSIKFLGEDMASMSEKRLQEIRGNEVAMIYQEPMASLNPAMKIGRQLMEVSLIHDKVSESEAEKRAIEMLGAVRLPDPRRIMKAYPHQISGGQQQRIVIAMALLSKPKLLILDEPTTALDVTVEAGIVELVKDLGKQFGTSMLFISHNLGLVLEVCNRITVMYSGEAVETGSIRDVFDRMRHPYTQGLFRSIPLPGADKNERPLIAIPGQLPLPHERPRGCNFGPRCSFFKDGVCNVLDIPMVPVKGEGIHASRCLRLEEIDWTAQPVVKQRAGKAPVGGTVLDIGEMKKYYQVSGNAIFGGGDVRTVKANEDVTIVAREAETVALVGESGCGKSTLAKVLMGLETKTSGHVKLSGKEIGTIETTKRDKKTLRSIQMVFQNPFDTLNPSMRVGDQIVRVLEKFGVGKTDAERRNRMFELLDLVKLPREFERRMPRQLSGGQKQRIGIARAFAGNPEVVVADEPVSALDVSVQAAVTELLMDIQRDRRTTMLFISHDLSIVRYLADRVVVMYLGHVVETGPTEAVFSPPYHPYTEALLSAVPIADTSIKKKHIVLEGDIPSAINPPPGCPFQTRCRWKVRVPGNLCETVVPELKEIAPGDYSKCHLSIDVLAEMEPVISQVKRGDDSSKPVAAESVRKSKGKVATPIASLASISPATKAKAPAKPAAPKAEIKPVAKAKTAPAVAKDNRPAAVKKPAKPDDLKLISGVGPKIEAILNGLGVYTFAQVASWKKAERDWVDEHLKFAGRIERDDWVKQAKALAKGGVAEYVKVFGKKPR